MTGCAEGSGWGAPSLPPAAPSSINAEGGICSFGSEQGPQPLVVDSPVPWEPVTRASWGSFLLQARCFQD